VTEGDILANPTPMRFVKLDVKIMDSSVWIDMYVRDIFITALLMARPFQLEEPAEQLKVTSLDPTGFIVPPGLYGFIPAAGIGIINRALVPRKEGYRALEVLGSPDEDSRSQEFGGRRLVRIDGGYLVLNLMKYREMNDGAERQRRYLARKKLEISAEARTVVKELGLTTPRLSAIIQEIINSSNSRLEVAQQLIKAYRAYLDVSAQGRLRFIWGPAKFFSEGHWTSDASWPIISGGR
jgi:hypothetical protein